MDTQYLILIAVIAVGALAYFFIFKEKPGPAPGAKPDDGTSTALQLQAYERMALLVDRITLSNLVGRTASEGLTAREMQLVLARSIRDEFDYNITQQIYITPETWEAVRSLKEKNLLLINHVASQLPADATGLDLNKAILEYIMNDPRASQHELVSQALAYEARKLL